MPAGPQNSELCPAQTESLPAIVQVGSALTVSIALQLVMQPFVFVIITV